MLLEKAKKILRPIYGPAVYRWRQSHPRLEIDIEQFAGFRSPVRELLLKAAKARFYRHSEQMLIRGFIYPRERQLLYGLARWLPGPIIEIGSWCGLSTTAIAHGIKDSGDRKQFRTYDLALTLDNFRPFEGGYGMFLENDNVTLGVCSKEVYENRLFPVLSLPDAAQGELRRNIEKCGLTKFVNIQVGDFRTFPPIVCGLVFCDALHDLHEIALNAPALRPFLRSSSILACHDIARNADLIAALRNEIPLGHAAEVDRLYVAEVL